MKFIYHLPLNINFVSKLIENCDKIKNTLLVKMERPDPKINMIEDTNNKLTYTNLQSNKLMTTTLKKKLNESQYSHHLILLEKIAMKFKKYLIIMDFN